MSNNKPENVNQVNNYFIDYYLNQLRKRLENVKNPNFIDISFQQFEIYSFIIRKV